MDWRPNRRPPWKFNKPHDLEDQDRFSTERTPLDANDHPPPRKCLNIDEPPPDDGSTKILIWSPTKDGDEDGYNAGRADAVARRSDASQAE